MSRIDAGSKKASQIFTTWEATANGSTAYMRSW